MGLSYVSIAFGFNFFSFCVRVSRWGKDVAQTCGSFFLSHFGGRSLLKRVRPGCVRTPAVWDWSSNIERIDVNSAPDELAKDSRNFHVYGSHLWLSLAWSFPSCFGRLCSHVAVALAWLLHLSTQFDASAIMSLVMFKGDFERIAFSLRRFKLLR